MNEEAMKLAQGEEHMKNLINCGTCGYPLTTEERNGLVEVDGVMVKPEQQEPYCYVYTEHGEEYFAPTTGYFPDDATPLYTSPQREWVGLTDGEWMNIVNKNQAWFGHRPDEVAHEVAKLVESKLKEKNT